MGLCPPGIWGQPSDWQPLRCNRLILLTQRTRAADPTFLSGSLVSKAARASSAELKLVTLARRASRTACVARVHRVHRRLGFQCRMDAGCALIFHGLGSGPAANRNSVSTTTVMLAIMASCVCIRRPPEFLSRQCFHVRATARRMSARALGLIAFDDFRCSVAPSGPTGSRSSSAPTSALL